MINLLPRELLIKRNVDDDCVNFYYKPVLGYFYRKRLYMIKRLLGKSRFNRVLEIGYGSGIFLPILAEHCSQLSGIDIHDYHSDIENTLLKTGVKAELKYGDLQKIPFEDNTFDCIVMISVLEHVYELDGVLKEIKRVLKKQGVLIAGFPTRNMLSSFFFDLVKFNHIEKHPSDHNRIIKFIDSNMKIDKLLRFPRYFPKNITLYNSVRAINE